MSLLRKGNPDAGANSAEPAVSIVLKKDPNGSPAVDISKVRDSGHVDLAKKADKAGISLSKRGLSGVRGAVRVYVDHSGSMEFPGAQDYSNGNVQRVVERALGYSFQVDSDGKIPVLAFDNNLHREVVVTVDNYQGVVNRQIWHPNRMGGTEFAPVLQDILKEAKSTTEPIFAVIVTDGNPSDRRESTRLAVELAKYPVHLKFLAIRPVDYLTDLDDYEDSHPGARLLDNVDTKYFDGSDCPPLSTISDLEFADAMADEVDSWIREATAKGVLR